MSKLIDTTPGTITTPADRSKGYGGDFEDAALAPGMTFTDPASGVIVKTDSVANGVAQVTVTFPTTQTTGGGKKATSR